MKRAQKTNIKSILVQHIKKNYKEYIGITAMFLIGIVIGVLFINNASIEAKEEITTHITTFVESLKTNKVINKSELLKSSISQNLFIALILWIVGGAVIGVPVICLIIVFKGFSLGYTISSAIGILGIGKGIAFSMATMFLQNIIFIPCIIALAVSGIKLSRSIMKDKRAQNIKFEMLRHTFFSITLAIFLVLCSLIEVYISTSLISNIIKIF